MSRWINPTVDAMQGYVPGEQPADPSVIKLNTNECPYPPSPAVADALRALDPATLRKYPDPRCESLRDALAALHRAEPGQVFVGNGSDELLALCTRAFVRDGGAIGYVDPSYSLYPILARIRAASVRPVPMHSSGAWPLPDGYRADLFFLTTPNAPTGRLVPRPAIEALCDRLDGVVVLDEAYVDFAREHNLDLALRRPTVLAARTLSKSYGLAGLRLGYAVGPAPLIEALFKIKDSYNVSRLTQAAALAALKDQAYMRTLVARIRATREATASALASLGFEVTPSDANFLWVKPPRTEAGALQAALRGRGILVRHFPGPRTGAYLRISIGTDAQMETLLGALRDWAT